MYSPGAGPASEGSAVDVEVATGVALGPAADDGDGEANDFDA